MALSATLAAATKSVIRGITDGARAHMGAHVLALMQECACTNASKMVHTHTERAGVCVCPSARQRAS